MPLRTAIRSLLVLIAVLLCAVPVAAAAPAAKVTVSKVSVKGAKVTVTGSVRLPRDTAAIRRKARVALTLANSKGKKESFSATIDAKRRFSATKTTKLTGALGLAVVVKIGGKASGKRLVKTVKVTAPAKGGATTGAGSTTGASTPSGGEATTTPGPASGGDAPVVPATPLVGLFRLDPGVQAVSGAISGTYFQMLGGPNADVPVHNDNSTALDKNYTLLRPGTDGGLRTDAFQPAPSPAFAGTDPVNGGPSGDALANRIVQPQSFLNINFSIATDAVDAQTAEADPLPRILVRDGQLSGQTTAWDAQWNGLSFNQGSPKPDGTSPSNTRLVTGTYDPATGHFVLDWRSLIVGGPFDGFTGGWHLEGTFAPAAS